MKKTFFVTVFLIAILVMIIKYRKLGLFAILSYIGYVAVLLIVVRYTNLVITMEGIFGIAISMILNYVLLIYLLQNLKKTDKNVNAYKNTFTKSMLSLLFIFIPTIIIGIVFCFAAWLPIYSFGTIIFWGIFIMAIYNLLVTRILFLNSIKE